MRTPDRRRLRRALPALLLMLSAVVAGVTGRPAPAEAGVYVSPFWVVYCNGCDAIVPRDGKPVKVPFGLISTGRATAAKVTLDTSGIDTGKVSVVGVEGPCTRSGSLISCDFGTIGKGNATARVILQAKPGAAAGAAGTVKLKSSVPSSDTTQSGKLTVSHDPSATDVSITSAATPGKIGGTATGTYTVRNNGPSVQPWVEVGVRPQNGTTFTGGTHCRAGSGGEASCRVNDLAVGASVKFTLTYRVGGCDKPSAGEQPGGTVTGLTMGYQDTYPYNETWAFRIPVTGCAGSGGATGGGTGTGTAGPKPSTSAPASPSPGAPVSASAQPGTTADEATAPATAAASPAASSGGPGAWPYLAGVVLLLLGLGGFLLARRRRTADADAGTGGGAPGDAQSAE